jgi:hypothetical protein
VNGTTPVHKNLMKDKPTIKTETEETAVIEPTNIQPLQREIYLRLVSAAAADGKFELGKLPNAQSVVKQGDHLKGVSELLASCFEK